ncbi:type I polyketide synthase [Gillisia sp. Hel_I_29]|uniref:type I polyketide synthase n=1 Tax=Gillisia sp. Hel_I_29 TaxID=1249975 RepID=UPI00068EC2DC|nr:type I polyketide synthase [Gillisia sp. Hel_I_29]
MSEKLIEINKTIVDVLRLRAEKNKDKVAYIFLEDGEIEESRITYAHLYNKSQNIAFQLLKNVNPGERVLLLYSSGTDFIEAFLGCLLAGVIAVPVNPPSSNRRLDRLNNIKNDCAAKLILCTSKLYNKIHKWSVYDENSNKMKILLTDEIKSTSKNIEFAEVKLEDTAFLQYTSGSTGKPKGAMVSHHNISHNCELIIDLLKLNEETIFVGWLPIFHDMGLIGNILSNIYIGSTLIFMAPVSFVRKPIRWFQAISKYKATITGGPNFAYDLCVENIDLNELKDVDLTSCKIYFSGAETVRKKTLLAFVEKFSTLGVKFSYWRPAYGMAETTLVVCGNNKPIKYSSKPLNDNAGSKTTHVSNGKALNGIEIKIVNPNNFKLCEERQEGEIWVKGASVTKGYWNKPELTKEVFQAYYNDNNGNQTGPFLRTGDVGYFDESELYISGRLKEMMIFNGKNFFPQDIEACFQNKSEYFTLNAGAAFSVEINRREQLIIAQEIKRTHLIDFDAVSLIRDIKSAIFQEFKIFVFDVLLLKPATIPKTSSGKIKRNLCGIWYSNNDFKRVLSQSSLINIDDNKKTLLELNSPLKRKSLIEWLQRKLSDILNISDYSTIDIKKGLFDLGLDSLVLVEFTKMISLELEIDLSIPEIATIPDIEALSDYILEKILETKSSPIEKTFSKNKIASGRDSIAIVGLSCRLPGDVNDLKSLAKLLKEEKNTAKIIPEDRIDISDFFNSNVDAKGKMYTRHASFIEGHDQFDAKFFGISPREAKKMDPQQRLLLECSWEALENGGFTKEDLAQLNVGVFIGLGPSDYSLLQKDNDDLGFYDITGTHKSFSAGRISYFLGVNGPCMTVDTACSSSLVALDLACKSLRNEESDLMIIGSAQILSSPIPFMYLSQSKSLAPDGICKPFSNKADGYGRSEGSVVLVLRRLSDAVANKETILGVIKGAAINHDGASSGLTVPNRISQEKMIKKALRNANTNPADVSYVEAHGAGTSIGDPIEINALENVYGANIKREQPLFVGSIKSNIGHLEAASGLAGLLKVLAAFKSNELPKSLYTEVLNEYVPWNDYSISILKASKSWNREKKPRIAGVSSFGLSGTNAHVILEEPPLIREEAPQNQTNLKSCHLFVFSGVVKEACNDQLQQLQEHLIKDANLNLEEIAYNLAIHRNHFPIRTSFIANSKEELIEKLKLDSSSLHKTNESIKNKKLAFLFTGHGSQYKGMCKTLYKEQKVFKEIIDECNSLLKASNEFDLLDVLFKKTNKCLDDMDIAQPVIFSIGYALFKLWESWGVIPDIVIGHSLGEITAACAAEVFTLEEGLMLVATRGKLLQKSSSVGAMVSIELDANETNKILSGYEDKVSIAAINGANQTTISGVESIIDMLCEKLTFQGVKTKKLMVSRASHSPLMEPVLEAFEKTLKKIKFKSPNLTLISCLDGEEVGNNVCDSAYWINHLRKPVQFEKGILKLESYNVNMYLEIGTTPILSGMASKILADKNKTLWLNSVWIPSLRRDYDELETIYNSLSELYANGINIDWKTFYKYKKQKRIFLPTYPFQRKRFWAFDAPKLTVDNEITVKPEIQFSNYMDVNNPKLSVNHKEKIKNKLIEIISRTLHLDTEELKENDSIIELGADSLMLMEVVKKVKVEFGVLLEFSSLFVELNDIDSIANFISTKTKDHIRIPSPSPSLPTNNLTSPIDTLSEVKAFSANDNKSSLGTLLSVFEKQNEILRNQIQQQNELLTQYFQKDESVASSNIQPEINAQNEYTPDDKSKSLSSNKNIVKPFEGVIEIKRKKLSEEKDAYKNELIKAYNNQTIKSKEFTGFYRDILADNRASSGFRISTKELLYPIISDRSKGSKIYDIDGNEYIDVTMGFGSCLFGHQQDFIIDSIQNQLNKGMHIGPQSHLVGEVATMVKDLTGFDRVCFANSGTEAVMIALRLVRSITGKSKIVVFNGSYHGHFDGTLGTPGENLFSTDPIAVGVNKSIVKDLLVLDFNSTESIALIDKHSDQIASVLIEPVRSRFPDELPNKEWLSSLRNITEKHNIPLIFDEIITGFRILPGGAQEYFGVKADIATYGKIAGGGMPLGIIAGSSKYLDVVDGGTWQYGDDSYPSTEPTFLAGTFTKHPLTLSASKAVLSKIMSTSVDDYHTLNKKTEFFATRLNEFFSTNEIQLEVVWFGSLFKFKFNKNYDLFFYELLNEGIYIWEGRICYLSFAHTDEDIDLLYNKITKSILKYENIDADFSRVFRAPYQKHYPVTLGQKSLWIHEQMSPESLTYNMSSAHLFQGKLDKSALRKSFETIILRHESLRTIFSLINGEVRQTIITEKDFPFDEVYEEIDITNESFTDKKTDKFVNQNVEVFFDLINGPLFKTSLILLDKNKAILTIKMHHIISDGWSLGIILNEWINLYHAYTKNEEPVLPELKIQYKDFAVWFHAYLESNKIAKDHAYWQEKLFNNKSVFELKTDYPRSEMMSYAGDTKTFPIKHDLLHKLEEYSKKNRSTVFITLLAITKILLYKNSGQNDIVIGTPVATRNSSDLDTQIGYHLNNLILRNSFEENELFINFLDRVKSNCIDAYTHQAYPYEKLVEEFMGLQEKGRNPFYDVLLVLDTLGNQNASRDVNIISKVISSKLEIDSHLEMIPFRLKSTISKLDLTLFFTIGDSFELSIEYRTNLFKKNTINKMGSDFEKILSLVVNNPNISIEQIRKKLMTKDELNYFINLQKSILDDLGEDF